MGRLVKNYQIETGSYSLQLPTGLTTTRPQVAADGQMRYNTTVNNFEFYSNGSWSNVGKVGTVSITKDTFTTANATVNYGPMSYTYTSGQENNVLVFVGGVFQTPITNYTFQGNAYIALNPTSGTAGQSIVLLHNFNSTNAA